MRSEAVVDHIPALRRYARVLTGDAWAADDLVQDTLERACVKWRLWLAGTDLRAWLFTLMHNLHANQHRDAQRRGAGSEHIDAEQVADELVAGAADPTLALDLQRCLLRLPTEQRAVLLLVTLEDMSYATVARVLGVPVGTVMSRLARARERLRALLDMPAAARDAAAAPVLRRLK